MMFARTTSYINDIGNEVNFRSMADILESILKQRNEGRFTKLNI